MNNKNTILEKTKSYIVELRRNKNAVALWAEFKQYLEENSFDICSQLDTRWLISITDTYVDYGNPIESRNALLVSTIANFEKLWGTYLYMHDFELNPDKEKRLRSGKSQLLWDGMYTFNIHKGDMSNNLFTRIKGKLVDTPVIKNIYETILKRLNQNETLLGKFNKYHRDFYGTPPKRSIIGSFIKRVRSFVKQYRLPLF